MVGGMKEANYRDILRLEFESRKLRNNSYSMRAFARSIELSSGALSEILQGKRNLSPKKAFLIAEKLKCDESEKEQFIESVNKSSLIAKNGEEGQSVHNLSLEVFEVISSPDCMSILAMSDLDGFKLNIDWIAKQLDITNKEVAYALKLMRDIGLLEVIDGNEQLCSDFVFSTDGIPSRAIRNYHHKMLSKASEALEKQAVEARDISGISFAIDPDQLSLIKKDILAFQKRMIKKYSQGNKKQVYHLEMALFALSNGEL